MWRYTLHRLMIMVPTLLISSMLIFTVMELPPTSYFDIYAAEQAAAGEKADTSRIEFLKQQYGFDKSPVERYFIWLKGLAHGDMGYSFAYELPVNQLVSGRIGLTMVITFLTVLVTWILAFPIGIYSATHQYSWGDYGLSTLGLLGISIPHFLLALICLYFFNTIFGISIGGLMDPQYVDQPLSWAKFNSILAHLIVPVFIIGAAGTGGMIRRLRANLLDELGKQYVVTARAKGLSPIKVLLKYPLRMALNFFIADIGDILPSIVSGAEITAIVMSIQTVGPLLLRALQSQDMYLAGSILVVLSLLSMVGVLISDILLAWLDPRVRLSGAANK